MVTRPLPRGEGDCDHRRFYRTAQKITRLFGEMSCTQYCAIATQYCAIATQRSR
jgi:hypothetical protein